jgi:hypothetical protein
MPDQAKMHAVSRSWPIGFARLLAKAAAAVGIGLALLSALLSAFGGPAIFYFGAVVGFWIVLGGLVLAVLARRAELRELERVWRE